VNPLEAPTDIAQIPLTADEWEFIATHVHEWERGAANSGNHQQADRLAQAWRMIVNYIDRKDNA